MKEYRQHTPLHVWLMTGVIILVIGGGAYGYYSFKKPIQDIRIRVAQERIAEFAGTSTTDGSRRIIGLGTSLLMNAAVPKQVDRTLAEISEKKIRLHMMNLVVGRTYGPVFSTYADAVHAIRPDILVLQSDIFWGGKGYSLASNLRGFWKFTRQWFRHVSRHRRLLNDVALLEMERNALSIPCTNRVVPRFSIITHARDIIRLYSPPIHLDEAFIDFIHYLERVGTQVVVLEIPRSSVMNAEIGHSRVEAFHRKVRAEISRFQSVLYWKYDEKLGESFYCDYSHFNSKGRSLFNHWFSDKLRNHFTARDPRL